MKRQLDRASEQVAGDGAAMERFKREHRGMTPAQFALAQFNESMETVYQQWPHLRPPEEKPTER